MAILINSNILTRTLYTQTDKRQFVAEVEELKAK